MLNVLVVAALFSTSACEMSSRCQHPHLKRLQVTKQHSLSVPASTTWSSVTMSHTWNHDNGLTITRRTKSLDRNVLLFLFASRVVYMADLFAILAGEKCGVEMYESPSREVYVDCEVTKARYATMVAVPILIVVLILCIWYGNTTVAVVGSLICVIIGGVMIFQAMYLMRVMANYKYTTFTTELDTLMSQGDTRSAAIDKLRARQLQREATAATLSAARQQSASIISAANIMSRNK